MSKTLEFYFDYGSPATYLAWTQLSRITEATQAALQIEPILLGGLFKATGNAPPAAVPAKGRYMLMDLVRCAQRFTVPLKMNPHFPVNTLQIMRITTGVQMHQPEQLEAVMTAFFNGMWVDGLNLSDPEVIHQSLSGSGLDADALVALGTDDAVKQQLKENTGKAAERGAFGAPTFFVGKDMFFGQDRLDFVEAALSE